MVRMGYCFLLAIRAARGQDEQKEYPPAARRCQRLVLVILLFPVQDVLASVADAPDWEKDLLGAERVLRDAIFAGRVRVGPQQFHTQA